jgi:sulfate permease, SulP family
VIAKYLPQLGTSRTLHDWLAEDLGSEKLADELIAHCEELHFKKGEIIAAQGDPADCMHFILAGRVAVIVKMRDGRTVRVRSLGFHTTIGEMGLISRQKRSATVKAEADSVLYALSVEAYERIARENPALSHALLTYVITVMADRLTFASKAMGVLRR